jgi:diaminopimelate epimerase
LATISFTKMQGAGNDFVLVDPGNMKRDWSQLAITMCDRHFGIGADGLLLVLPSDTADCQMHIFNPDGSEAEACGNGLRCLAKYVVDKGLVKAGSREISIETLAGVRKVKLHKTDDKTARIQVGMGEPKFGAEDIPVIIAPDKQDKLGTKPILNYPVKVTGREIVLSFVSMGNPHAVYFWSQPVSDFPLSEVGPQVEQMAIFPNRTNFEVAYVVPTPPQPIEVRVWERGAGETLACGSGACAVAVAARQHGYINSNKVDIKLPGGVLEVEWDGAGEVFLSGPTETVFTGEWPEGSN